MKIKLCECGCGEAIPIKNKLGYSARFKHGHNSKGINHPNFKGHIKRSGYWYKKVFNHPHGGKQNYVAEHRLVMEKHLGRYLKPAEAVHHIDGNITNNNINNLQLFKSKGQHTKIAHPEISEKQKVRINFICNNCGKSFERAPHTKRYKNVYCSQLCYKNRRGIS